MLFVLLMLQATNLHAQTKKGDSLNRYIHSANTADDKLRAIIAYTDEYYNICHDSLSKYAAVAIQLAAPLNNNLLKSQAQLILAYDYIQWGWMDSVFAITEAEIPKCDMRDKDYRQVYFKFSIIKSVALGSESRMQECLDNLYKLIPYAEEYKDTLHLAQICNTIGFIASARNEIKEGIKWNDKALQYIQGLTLMPGRIGSIYVTRASLYNKSGLPDSALYFLQKGIDLCTKGEYIDRLVGAYRLQSAILTDQGKYTAAEEALMNMINTRKKLNQQEGFVVDDNIQIADFYANTGQLQKAIDLCRKFLVSGELKKEKKEGSIAMNNDAATRLAYYVPLAGYLKQSGDTKGYTEALENIITLKDSVAAMNSTEAIAEMQAKYDVQEKEKTILEQELQLTRRNTMLYGSIGFIVMAGIIGLLVFRNQRRAQQEKLRIAVEEEKNMAVQSILEAEEKERKRIAADLHDNIGAYATAIRDDVDKITGKSDEAAHLHLDHLRQHSQEIINSLRDTIWVLNKENITITGLSDRFKNYTGKLQPSYPGINININEQIEEDIVIPSRKALNIFRIMQEAVHNALKHSNAKNISITICSNEHISIAINDDGSGFDELAGNHGNGMINMKARAEEAGLLLAVHSEKDKGTEIMLKQTT
ncbi:MAG TPA: sensor histidine kinase [Panacibacter sp.]|nr:sensor histidine kinase [Panacibacter sp.]HNP45984.1 sensor histidine kinase [Panacibacter sp.]